MFCSMIEKVKALFEAELLEPKEIRDELRTNIECMKKKYERGGNL